jgi:hypothetical protein
VQRSHIINIDDAYSFELDPAKIGRILHRAPEAARQLPTRYEKHIWILLRSERARQITHTRPLRVKRTEVSRSLSMAGENRTFEGADVLSDLIHAANPRRGR